MTRNPIVRGLTAFLTAAVIAFGSRPVPAASPCEWTGIDRVVAIGDVHGAYDRFVEILKVAGVVDAGSHWAGGTTHVVQLGDILDRGDDSRKPWYRKHGLWLAAASMLFVGWKRFRRLV